VHPGGAGGLHAEAAVFDHHAPLGCRSHPAGGVQEEIRGGLAVGHLRRAVDAAVEPRQQAGVAEGPTDLCVTAAGGDTGAQGDLVEGGLNARHGLQLGVERRMQQWFVGRLEPRRQGAAEVFLYLCGERCRRGAEELLDDLVDAEVPTEVGEHPLVDLHGDDLAVDEHPVTIEDDQVDAVVHRRSPCVPGAPGVPCAPRPIPAA
jgi:hypothetical protein